MRRIAACKQDGSIVRVYSETGTMLFQQQGVLVGYTDCFVTIKQGSSHGVYDASGNKKFNI